MDLFCNLPMCLDCGVPGAEIGGGAGTLKLLSGCPWPGIRLPPCDSAKTLIPGA